MKPTVYTDPYSGHEVLLLESEGVALGITYDPTKTSPVVPFTGECAHCRQGERHDAPMHARRQIQFLLSAETSFRKTRRGMKVETTYVLPPASRPIAVTHWLEGREHHLLVRRRSPRKQLRVLATPAVVGTGLLLSYEGDRRYFQGQILARALRFLLSARPASREHVAACLAPMLNIPVPKRGRPRRCRTIDWKRVAESLARPTPRRRS